ncbi:chromosomal replication initiator protein DnaA [Candidatus Curtissbacteria bacterium RIFCSPLOWO2_01_FULL_37_9]|uniref:Chromosomal replication initiator protein DnaA n=1 Tax=Candidatus Curtissbacteria bacterium RIFCSPLOWO2_01_FULL_37_9 TaxID=1797724 RepID=A0A1F5GR62_9BACT|nr:MAG: chromosomal replication initiator protein DnaA [Candidatus Curtissbacteria bacterium RIFCSPLOWO2_01_FULL_37_9]
MEGPKIWSRILLELKKQFSKSAFNTWISGSYVLEYQKNNHKNLLIIGTRNSFIKEQVEKRYLPAINRLIVAKKLGNIEVIFVVSQKDKTKKINKEPIFSGIASSLIITSRSADVLNPDYSFENFVVGPSNNLAYLVAKQVCEKPGRLYNPLFIWGNTGVGKTHLLQAIGNEILTHAENAKVLYAPCEKFTNDYLNSLTTKTQASFRSKYRSLDVLLIDDIQFLAGKESTQDEFFYTFNELHLSQRQIVLACDRHPKELGRLKERLISRLVGGMTIDVGPADFEMRLAILKVKCEQKGLQLSDEIVSYIAQSCTSGARELEGFLISVLPLIKLSGNKIGLEEIKAHINKNQSPIRQKPTPEKIIEAVCSHFKLNPDALCGPSRKASLILPRQILMYFLRKELHLPLEQVGRFVGGRDHSTIIYGIDKIEKIIPQNRSWQDEILRIKSFFYNN